MLASKLGTRREGDAGTTFSSGVAPSGHAGGVSGSISIRAGHHSKESTTGIMASSIGTTAAGGVIFGRRPLPNGPEVGILVQERRCGGGDVTQDER